LYRQIVPPVVIGRDLRLEIVVREVPLDQTVDSITWVVLDDEEDVIITSTITGTQTSSGQITASGVLGTASGFFTVSNTITNTLDPEEDYHYRIELTGSYLAGTQVLEVGKLLSLSMETQTLTAMSTTADPSSDTYSERVQRLIDAYLDNILHDYRQLKVWDEHARRSAHDPLDLKLTYPHMNRVIPPEIYDQTQQPIAIDRIIADYDRSLVRVKGDDGNQDYFVTYEMNLFPPEDLYHLLNLTLMEINATAPPTGGRLTSYLTIDEAPLVWDAPLVLGTAAKAFLRLASDGTLWRNRLIWADGGEGQQVAMSQAQTYFQGFQSTALATKMGHYLARPTAVYDLFRVTGFGFVNPQGSKFRGLRVNRIVNY
jgi:hypothetical protein